MEIQIWGSETMAHITLTILRSQHGGTIGKANTEPIAQLLN